MGQEDRSHTGRELELMRVGRKPMAMFYAATIELPNEALIPEEEFSIEMSTGRITRHSFEFETTTPRGDIVVMRYVLFTLHGEEWRSAAMELLVRSFNECGSWNETCERMVGALLGYSSDEIDEYCRKRFSTRCDGASESRHRD